MSSPEIVHIEPYARLLTMLSEQLIKNEVVALTEIVKNSYDADARWVKITFENFSKNMTANKSSRIIIEDSGCGMSDIVLKNDFVNPATANKKVQKEEGRKTPRGRVYQGEKGIGRFSLFKLGKKISVITKTSEDNHARKLVIDLSQYEDEFIKKNNEQYKLSEIETHYFKYDETDFNAEIFLDVATQKRVGHGTIITVEELNDKWGKSKIEKLKSELFSLIGNVYGDDFKIYFYNGLSFIPSTEISEKELLSEIIEQKAVYRILGRYDENKKNYEYKINDKHCCVGFDDSKILGLSLCKDFVKEIESQGNNFSEYKTSCGSFDFEFNIFDNDKQNVRAKFKLDDQDWIIVKKNRVFLYRDGIRVFPYGSVNDDWLQVDTIRGTKRANAMFSNDQVVGYINISYQGNPNLRDKTNREGLLEVGTAYSDFLRVIQIFLQHIKTHYYNLYAEQKKVIKKFDKQQQRDLDVEFNDLLQSCADENVKRKIVSVREKVEQQNDYNLSRIRVVEDLAGIGLSIQATHHDIHNFVRRCYHIIDDFQVQLAQHDDTVIDKAIVVEKMEQLRGVVSLVEAISKDIKNLFTTTQYKKASIRVALVLDKVLGYYRNVFDQQGIRFELKSIGNNPLVIKMPEALLMTIFINILDNALYWLDTEGKDVKQIRITINSDENYILFSDNGPGIYSDEREKIFEAFFTGKGVDGRGLGLYICKQFLDRYDYSIDVNDDCKYVLSGANFKIDFSAKED